MSRYVSEPRFIDEWRLMATRERRDGDLLPDSMRENRMQLADLDRTPARKTMAFDFRAKFDGMRLAQRSWSALDIGSRLAVIRRSRKQIAANPMVLAESVPVRLPGALSRNQADTLVSEVLPLLEACRFLEREAQEVLRTRYLGSEGRPIWLGRVESRVERAPWGIVLILGASNYPLLLAGVQALQALVAGNAVVWKPAPGTESVARAFRDQLLKCGLEAELLTILDAEIEAATGAIEAGVDHVILTGSVATGKAVLRQLAETLTPATMELSGADAVFVLPSADVSRLIEAIVFGLRFNGSFTCMAPRRIFLVGLEEARAAEIEDRLKAALMGLTAVPVPESTCRSVREMIEDARRQGARIAIDGLSFEGGEMVRATLILDATPEAKAMRTEIFAPIVTMMRTNGIGEALAANAACAYGLTASIFGDEADARAIQSGLRVGTVLLNDIITSTADPRIPFGGRGRSGFGVTRGAEGLLAMTTPRTIQITRRAPRQSWAARQSRAARRNRAYEATGDQHSEFFTGLIQMLHGSGLAVRLQGLRRLIYSARRMK